MHKHPQQHYTRHKYKLVNNILKILLQCIVKLENKSDEDLQLLHGID